jgi:hypothetical protein
VYDTDGRKSNGLGAEQNVPVRSYHKGWRRYGRVVRLFQICFFARLLEMRRELSTCTERNGRGGKRDTYYLLVQ